MTYIKKNVNLLLLLLIALIMVAFVGISSYYQGTYKNISLSYSQKLDELTMVGGNLSQREAMLNKTTEELQVRTEDKVRFELMYSNLTDVKERLERELAKTRDELDSTKVDLANAQSQLTEALTQITDLTTKVAGLEEDINTKNALIRKLKISLCTYNSTYC